MIFSNCCGVPSTVFVTPVHASSNSIAVLVAAAIPAKDNIDNGFTVFANCSDFELTFPNVSYSLNSVSFVEMNDFDMPANSFLSPKAPAFKPRYVR